MFQNLLPSSREPFKIDLSYFLKNGFWVALRQAVLISIGLLIPALFIRLTGQELFGQYQLVLSFFALISIFSLPGLNTALTQSVAQHNDGDYKTVVKKSFQFSLLGSVALFLAGIYYFFVKDPAIGMAAILAAIFVPFFYAPNTWDAFLSGKEKYNVSALWGSLQALLSALVLATVLLFSRNLSVLVVTTLFCGCLFNILWYQKSKKYITFPKKSDNETLPYGWFLTKLVFLGTIAVNIDKIIVGFLLGPEELAIYVIVSLLAIAFKDVSKTIIAISVPRLSKFRGTFADFFRIHALQFFLILGGSFLAGGLFYFLIPAVNGLFFTQDYSEYFFLAQMFTVTIICSPLAAFFGYFIQVRKDRVSLYIVNPFYFSLRILLAFVLIYNFQLLGAVIAYNISAFLSLFLSFFCLVFETTWKRQ